MMIHPGSYWTHRLDGYEVQVGEMEGLRIKAPSDANWHQSVTYRRTDEEDGELYARTLDDFLDKFEPVKQDEGDA
jgi:hypothetical protein